MKNPLVLIITSFALGLATVASAQTDTYIFTGGSATGAFPANTIDGSTLTITGGTITDFDFTAAGLGLFATPSDVVGVSQDVTSYGPSGWSGTLDMTYAGYVDIEVTGDSFSSSVLQSSITGTWAAVPDGVNTFALLGMVVVGLAVGRPALRRLH